MSVGINQFIMMVLNPLALGLIGLILGLIAALCRWRRTRWTLVGLSFVWLWVWSSGWWYNIVGSHLEDAFPQVLVEEIAGPIDAVHILGGGMGVNTNDCLNAEMCAGADRVWIGAKVWEKVSRVERGEHGEKEPLLICSGGCVRESTLPLLADLGVDTNKVVLLDQAKNTEEEAKLVNELVVSRPLLVASNRTELTTNDYQLTTSKPRVALVTSVWHMRRAKFLFEKLSGCEIVPVPCDYECTTDFGPSHKWSAADFVPNAQWLFRNCYLAKEYVAYWGYRVKFLGK